MSISELARRLFLRAAPQRCAPPRVDPRTSLRTRLAVEALEDRTTPTLATVSVVSLGDIAENGSTSSAFRFSRSDAIGAYSVGYSTTGTAFNPTDYNSSGLIVFFNEGQSQVDITITAIDDTEDEDDETIIFTVSADSSSPYEVGSPGSATMNLIDNDLPQVSVARQGGDPTEGAGGTFRISRVGSNTFSLGVTFSVGGTATSGADFTAIGTGATIAAGKSYVDVAVATLVDNAIEGDETVTIAISGSTTYTVSGGGASLTIIDDAPVVSVARVADGKEGVNNGTFRISRSGGNLAQAITVNYTMSGTAVSGADYTAPSGSVSVGSSTDVTIAVIDDSTVESAETAILTITASTAYAIGTASATLFIWDNELAPFYWTGTQSDAWFVSGNWLGNEVPTPSDAVYFVNQYAVRDSLYSGPISGSYSVAEMHVGTSYSYKVTLAFPLTVGALAMQGGTIDQPSSGYGSDLTITSSASWTGGTLNSTTNAANVIFNGATVSIDGSSGLASGSDLEFVNATAAIDKGTITFSNGQGAIITGSSYITIGSISGGVINGPVKVDGGTVKIVGGTSLTSLYVLNGGTAFIVGGGTVSFTGTVPGWTGTSVLVLGGKLNIQNGTTLNAGSNNVNISGWNGAAELNTYASANKSQTTASITAAKLIVGSSGTVTVTIDKADLAPGDHVYSVLAVTGPIEWEAGVYVPTVAAAAGTRDRWTTTGTFKIKGSTTTVEPISAAGVSVNSEYAVMEAAGTFTEWANDNGAKPNLPLVNGKSEVMWEWTNASNFGASKVWHVKSKAV